VGLQNYLRRNLRRVGYQVGFKKFTADLALIKNSGYFDDNWYRQNNPDVFEAGADPLRHYLEYGGFEGRTPGPKFDSAGYLDTYADVRRSGVNPLVHYLKFGRQEGRSPYGARIEAELIEDMLAIQEVYQQRFSRLIDFRHPTKFNEKIQIIKLLYRNPIMTDFSDKVRAKELAAAIIGEQYIVPTIGVYEHFSDIHREALPDRFVMKTSHGSGFTLICEDKANFDWVDAEAKMNAWLNYDFYARFREWAYKNIKPKILIEKLLTDENDQVPMDCKIEIAQGNILVITLVLNKHIGSPTAFKVDTNWQRLSYTTTFPPHPSSVERPVQMDLMESLAIQLASGFPYVRVDFYPVQGKVYFGEMTFYPAAGLGNFNPPEWDEILGSKLDLSQIYDPTYLAHLTDLAESKQQSVAFTSPTEVSKNSAKDDQEADLPETLAKVLSVLAPRLERVIDFVPKGAGLLKFAAVKSPQAELYALVAAHQKLPPFEQCFAGTKSSELILKPGSFEALIELLNGNNLKPTLLHLHGVDTTSQFLAVFGTKLTELENLFLVITGLENNQNWSAIRVMVNQLMQLGFDLILPDEAEHLAWHPQDLGHFEVVCQSHPQELINLVCSPRGSLSHALFYSHSVAMGGAERSLLELVQELTGQYHTLCTVFLPAEGNLEKELQKAGALTKRAPVPWWCMPEESQLPDVKAAFVETSRWWGENYTLLRDLNPDVVLTNTLTIPWGAIGALMLGKPHIWMVNEFGVLDHGLHFLLGFENSLEFIRHSSARVITRSRAIQQELFPQLDFPRVETIYWNIALPQEEVETDTNATFLHPEAFHLLLSGSITKAKGQEDAIRAASELIRHRQRQVELLMLGYNPEPAYKARMEEAINTAGIGSYVRILPFQAHLTPLLKQADAVLVCSRMEGLGRTCVEAMLMKKPVIGTNSGGIPELIEDGSTGLLYSPGDYLELADQIERLMDDAELRESLAVQGQRFALETFTPQRFGGRFNQIIHELRGDHGASFQELETSIREMTAQSFLDFIRNSKNSSFDSRRQDGSSSLPQV